MNNIIIKNDLIISSDIKDISVDYINKTELFMVSSINIIVNKSCDLKIKYEFVEETKLNINITLLEDVTCNLLEIKTGLKNKIKYHINLNRNSTLNRNSLNTTFGLRELDIIDLNGLKSTIKNNIVTISREEEKYDLIFNHNAPKTSSYSINRGLTKDNGSLKINMTAVVDNGIKGCLIEENNRVILENNNISEINPNLLVDEQDTIANHGAYIGSFNPNELFYLESRGINKKMAKKLLTIGYIKGCLVEYLNDLDVINILKELDMYE